MIPADGHERSREIALGLVAALAPVLADRSTPQAVDHARQAARGLGLAGLDDLLAACGPRAGEFWPG